MFRLAVTASPWDQSDLWPLRNGRAWKQKHRPFVRVKGKTSAGPKTRWEEGGLAHRDLSSATSSEREHTESHCTSHHYDLKSPLFYPLMPPAASWLSRKNWLKRKKEQMNTIWMRISLMLILESFLSHHHRSHWSQSAFHFLDWIWAWINDLRGLHITVPVEKKSFEQFWLWYHHALSW